MTKQGSYVQKEHSPMSRAWREDIENAVRVMRQGGVIIYPTDTIWGIGCDATSEDAVRRIFDVQRLVFQKVEKLSHFFEQNRKEEQQNIQHKVCNLLVLFFE